MSSHTIDLTDALHEYLVRQQGCASPKRPVGCGPKRSPQTRWHVMQISPEQGAFMALLVRLLGARRAVEVGTFTGYSALVVAEALPEDGRLVACDVSEEWTAIGRPFWERAGVAHKIDLRLRPAVETLDALLADGQSGAFDFAFIDADKANYDAYYERCLRLLRPGGVVGIDNVLWGGRVADAAVTDQDTAAIRALERQGSRRRPRTRHDAADWRRLHVGVEEVGAPPLGAPTSSGRRTDLNGGRWRRPARAWAESR